MKFMAFATIGLLFLCSCTSRLPSSIPTPTPNIYRVRADIRLEDKGKIFTYSTTTRFSVYLDDQDYPVREMACSP